MFVVNDQYQVLEAAQLNSLISVFQSVNEEEIALGNRTKGKAKAYIYAFEDTPENYFVEICFHLRDANESLRFKNEQGSVQRFRLKAVEDQALEFVESMGFMMDNLQIQNIPASQKRDLLKALPMFQRTQKPSKEMEISREMRMPSVEANITSNDEIKHKISKLLSSF